MAASGLFRLIRFSYPQPFEGIGFWGRQTSTLNWCEEDYILTHYCAELCNTLTNLVFLYLGYRAYGGYMLVGLGSIAFHASLKYPMQLWDELSMIYTTCLVMFASFSYTRSIIFSSLLGAGLLSLAAFISVYYHITKDPEFHQTVYGILTAIVVFHGMWVMESRLRPTLRARHGERGNQIVKTMWAMVATGLSVFLCGFLIWNLDNIYCGHFRRWRREIGLPWAILLEGHGWWHLMTGLGYYYIAWGIWLRRCMEGEDVKYRLHWPSMFTSIPEVIGVRDDDAGNKKLQ